MSVEWLNESLFEDILKKEYKEYQVISFVVKDAVPKGENYASMIKRVSIGLKLTDSTETIKNYIIKSDKSSEFSSYVNGTLYPKERLMFEKFIPRFESLFKETPEKAQFAPICYKTMDDIHTFILDDLQSKNFVHTKRQQGMDLQHAEATLAKLAQFHAASRCIFELEGPYPDIFDEGLYKEELVPIYENMFQNIWPIIYKDMTKWTDCKEYVDKLAIQKPHMIHLLMESLTYDPSEFNVLNHGDLWSNNIMFQYKDDGSMNEVLFIDFQLCKWGSPVQDLLHFIITSCNPDIRVSKFDYLISHYHKHLTESLNLLNFNGKIPELDDLHAQLKKRGYYGVNTSLSILPAVLMEPGEKTLQQSLKIYSNPKYREAMKDLLQWFSVRGLLDI